MARKRPMSGKQLQQVKDLNKRLSKKKSNLKQRYGGVVDVPKIDVNAKGKELKKQIERVENFLNPNANKFNLTNNKGVEIPFSDVKKINQQIKKINRIKEKEKEKLKELDFKVHGKVIGKAWQTKYGNLRGMDEMIPLTFKLDWFNSKQHFDSWVKQKNETYKGDFIQRSREDYQRNYIQGLRNEMGNSNMADGLISVIEAMSPDDFYYTSLSNNEGHLKWIYEAKIRDYEDVMDEIADVWMRDYKDKYIQELENSSFSNTPEFKYLIKKIKKMNVHDFNKTVLNNGNTSFTRVKEGKTALDDLLGAWGL